MVPHFLLAAFLVLVFRPQNSQAATSSSPDSDDCPRKCGNIDIPYPFGMGQDYCYLDETFRVTCDEASALALPWLNWELGAISVLNHTFIHKNFSGVVMPFQEAGGAYVSHSSPAVGTHYRISHARNTFVAMGCEFFVYLVDQETSKVQGSCSSLCNPNDTIPAPPLSSCSGLNCCQITFPIDLRNLSVRIQTTNSWTPSSANQCGFFTFVDNDFLGLNKMKQFSACNQGLFAVPMVHEWAVGNANCNEARGRGEYLCGQNTECIDYSTGIGRYRCKCRNGYSGNPYLSQGCQDIDECADPRDNNCPAHDRCVNTAGTYFCLPSRSHMVALFVPLGSGLAAGIIILAAIAIWTWHKLKKLKERKLKQKFFKKNGGLLLQPQISSSILLDLTLFQIEELEKATDKFNQSRILGIGGLGTVYKGMLSDGRIVAVKKANLIDDRQVGQFINEVLILSQVNHRHIVKLLGCCLETEVPLLVYEYVPNGTLSDHLHDYHNSSEFSWVDRLRIAAEVAGALAYLHSYASTAIFHRDIKSNNILLDDKYRAVVSDFGISRSVSIDKTHLTTLVGGTFGYLDPQYFRSGQLNDKSDVYAFGVVLAEILTGQRAVSSSPDDAGLALRFRSAFKENCLIEMLDKVVMREGEKEGILAVATLAKRCLKLNARKRPSMKELAADLDQLRNHQVSFQETYRLTSD